ncbi:MAG: universal stress protein [Armatimonadetes bacterium]|nr:universal stress protein [Armatimonadota bacterium]
MIIEAREDVVTLRGSLVENMWPALKAAANLLLRQHSTGIIIDCGSLEKASGAGVQTFVDAMNYIQKQGARILLTDVPEEVMQVLREVPGAGSQLPVARTIEEARHSLELQDVHPTAPAGRPGKVVLVPIVDLLDWEHGVGLACRLADGPRAEIRLVYLLEVPLSLPVGAALPEAEERAREALNQARTLARDCGVQTIAHVERTRELAAGILQAARDLSADVIVTGVRKADGAADPRLERVLSTLLQKAECEVVIDRAQAQSAA